MIKITMIKLTIYRYIFALSLLSQVMCAADKEVRISTLESTYKIPEGLVKGGSFIDRFLPVPLRGELRSDVWGGENVIPRDVNNGIEDAEYSYWGGNIVIGDDGKNHLFVCRWPEDNKKGKRSGHGTWWSSTVVHAVSEDPLGPYKVVEEIGLGHNPEIYRLNDGSYIIGVMGGGGKAYKAATLDGPWDLIKSKFDWIDGELNTTNRTYVPREDGSVLMVNKNGFLFISEEDEEFRQISERSFYPHIAKSHLEDPVIWKDEVQYNAIINDAHGRIAFYFRSADGIRWKWMAGKAYDQSIMVHENGFQEKWFKLERPKVRLDQYGRATHMNFAAIDTIKFNDLANDNHSSKNVVIPLIVPRRMVILNKEAIYEEAGKIHLKILAEEGFDPYEDIDLKSLAFGAPEVVNFGKGCRALSSKRVGSDLVVTFPSAGNGITDDNFAAKLIGRTKSGSLLYGYAKILDLVE